ncbi:MAG: hypothetical protein AB1414_01125 [bacterium]
MVLDDKEKNFLRNNKEVLKSIFNKRLEELKDISTIDEKSENIELDLKVQKKFVDELRQWIGLLMTIDKTNGGSMNIEYT